MNAETTISNIIAALTAIAGALATLAGFVPEQWTEVVLAISTGSALLAGNLKEWKETFLSTSLLCISAAFVAVACGCGGGLGTLGHIDFVGEKAKLTSTFSSPAYIECSEGSGCEGTVQGAGAVTVTAGGFLVVGESEWPMEGEARGYVRAGLDGAEAGGSVCLDSLLFADINKVLSLVAAVNPSNAVPMLPSPLCATTE
jgi:hypothetical protein